MKYTRIHSKELDESVVSRWLALLVTDPLYHSPYFHPAYTQAIARARDDVYLLLAEHNNRICGILPLHHTSQRTTVIGEGLTDYQGWIRDETELPDCDIAFRQTGIHRLDFNHVPAEFAEFQNYVWKGSRSLTMDLSGGYGAYQQKLQTGREASLFKKIDTSVRKLGNKVGPVRFVWHSAEQRDLNALLAGKSDQFVRTLGEHADIFRTTWIRESVEMLHSAQAPLFAGVLSGLYAGDVLIAAHFGIRSGKTLHYWFPWYDTRYAEYSPGLILLARCADAAAEQGLTMVDLGRGEQAYKQRFATGSIALSEGVITVPAWKGLFLRKFWLAREQMKSSVFGQQLRKLKNRLR